MSGESNGPASIANGKAVDFVVPAEGRCVSSAVRGDLDLSALGTDVGTCPFSLDMVSFCHFTKVRGHRQKAPMTRPCSAARALSVVALSWLFREMR